MAAVALPPKTSVKLTFVNILSLYFYLIFTIRIEETQCAYPFDVNVYKVSATEPPPRTVLMEIVKVNPLLHPIPSRRGHLQHVHNPRPASRNSHGIADLLQSIYEYDQPKLLHLHEAPETGYKNTLNRQHNYAQNFQHGPKILDLTNIQNFGEHSQDSGEESDSKVKQKYISHHQYSYNADHYPKYYKDVKKLQKVTNQSPFSSNLQLLYKKYALKQPQKIINSKIVIDDRDSSSKPRSDYIQGFLDALSITNKHRSKVDDTQQFHIVKNDKYNRNVYPRGVLDIISIEEQDSSLKEKQRYRRQFPLPEKSEAARETNDNDLYYESPYFWPRPADNNLHPTDPRNPKSPFYGNVRIKYVPGAFVNDDYQTFLGPDIHPLETKIPGHTIFLSQAIPLLKSMIMGTGIEQGPKDSPFRIHWTDVKHYHQNVTPPVPGPRDPPFNMTNNDTESIRAAQYPELYTSKPPKKTKLRQSDKSTADMLRYYSTKVLPVERNAQNPILNSEIVDSSESRRIDDSNSVICTKKPNLLVDSESNSYVPKKLLWWPKKKIKYPNIPNHISHLQTEHSTEKNLIDKINSEICTKNPYLLDNNESDTENPDQEMHVPKRLPWWVKNKNTKYLDVPNYVSHLKTEHSTEKSLIDKINSEMCTKNPYLLDINKDLKEPDKKKYVPKSFPFWVKNKNTQYSDVPNSKSHLKTEHSTEKSLIHKINSDICTKKPNLLDESESNLNDPKKLLWWSKRKKTKHPNILNLKTEHSTEKSIIDKINSEICTKKPNQLNNDKLNKLDPEYKVSKRPLWWPKEKETGKNKPFHFDKNKNYTIIIKVF